MIIAVGITSVLRRNKNTIIDLSHKLEIIIFFVFQMFLLKELN